VILDQKSEVGHAEARATSGVIPHRRVCRLGRRGDASSSSTWKTVEGSCFTQKDVSSTETKGRSVLKKRRGPRLGPSGKTPSSHSSTRLKRIDTLTRNGPRKPKERRSAGVLGKSRGERLFPGKSPHIGPAELKETLKLDGIQQVGGGMQHRFSFLGRDPM